MSEDYASRISGNMIHGMLTPVEAQRVIKWLDVAGPMTSGNMRANGVRSLLVYCLACHRETVLNAEAYPDDVPVPAFSPRMVCTKCGKVGADARPNWGDRRRPGPLG